MKYNISRVAVLGSGLMGVGIAGLFIGAGIPVLLMDMASTALLPEEEELGLTLNDTEVRNRLALKGKERLINPKNRILYDESMIDLIEVGNFSDDLEKINDCDLIIEVIVENLEIKQNLLQQIDKIRNNGSIVATNTSGISVNDIVQDCSSELKEHFLGMHFFNPPRYLKLLEIIPGKNTLPKLVEDIKEFCEKRLGRGIIIAKGSPNFVANRIGHQGASQALQKTLKYNYSVPKVDALLGAVIGRPRTATYKTIDMSGLDVFYYALQTLYKNIDSEYERTQTRLPDFYEVMLKQNILGDKTGGGFYKKQKDNDGNIIRLARDLHTGEYFEYTPEKIPAIEHALQQGSKENQLRDIVWGDSEENKFVWENIKATLLYCARNAFEIADNYEEIDKAMRWGYNWTFGPFEIWDIIGVEESIKRMQEEGDTVAEWVCKRISQGKNRFYEDGIQKVPYIQLSDSERYPIVSKNEAAMLKDIGDGVLCFEINTKGNSISPEVVDMINESLDIMEKNNDYIGMVVANHGKIFSAGVNLKSTADIIHDKRFDFLEKLIVYYHNTFKRMKYAKKPVITCPHGMTLGGGAELAMTGYSQVAHIETYMGLVELGVGLIPGGSGTKEMLYRHTGHLGKASLDEKVNAMKTAWEIISTGRTSSNAYDALNLRFFKETDVITMSLDYLIDVAKKQVVRINEDGFRPNVKRDIVVTGTAGKEAVLSTIDYMKEGNQFSEYDVHLAKKVSHILAGGDVAPNTVLSEDNILELEREAFFSLCGEPKTLERIDHFLKTGKRIKN